MLFHLVFSMTFAIIVSAFCSVAEAVLYSLPLAHIEVMVKKGQYSGLILKKMKKDIQKAYKTLRSYKEKLPKKTFNDGLILSFVELLYGNLGFIVEGS